MDSLSDNIQNQSIISDKKISRYASKHKESRRIADLYTVLAYDESKAKSERKIFLNKAQSIRDCNNFINYFINKETGEKMFYSLFCQKRFCPICAYNDSLRHFKIFSEIVQAPQVKNKKWLFITLTIKNSETDTTDLKLTCDNLKQSIETILQGFRSLTTSKKSFLKAHSLGMMRSLEITRNKRNKSFHPHLHLLVCVDSDYGPNSKDWITKDKLQKHWQKVCHLDYLPIVDIEFVDTAEKHHAVAEVAKYQTKSTDIINADTLYILDNVLNRTRCRGYTGIVKELKAEIEERLENEKIDLKEIILDERFVKGLLRWDNFHSCFRIDRKGSEVLNNALKEKARRNKYLEDLANNAIALQN